METVVSNVKTNQVRRVRSKGREYLVAPVSMIVPGVLAGSQGPLYYSPEEIAKNHSEWDGVPITVYHPFKNGRAASALEPGIWETQGIGYVRKPRIGNRKHLGAEAWIDIILANKIDKRVVKSLMKQQAIEVSTGLHTTNIPSKEPGVDHKGRSYGMVATNYRPDHLAILPDQVGACSIQDGCGVLVNEKPQWQPVRTQCHCQLTTNALPSDKLNISPEKACQILRDKTVHGKPITESQRGLFGVRCGQRSKKKVVNQMNGNQEEEWMPILNEKEVSMDERMMAVESAFRNSHPSEYDPKTGNPLSRCYLVAVYETYVVYREEVYQSPTHNGYMMSEGMMSSKPPLLYRQSYKNTKKGIVFADDAEPVERVVQYVPIS